MVDWFLAAVVFLVTFAFAYFVGGGEKFRRRRTQFRLMLRTLIERFCSNGFGKSWRKGGAQLFLRLGNDDFMSPWSGRYLDKIFYKVHLTPSLTVMFRVPQWSPPRDMLWSYYELYSGSFSIMFQWFFFEVLFSLEGSRRVIDCLKSGHALKAARDSRTTEDQLRKYLELQYHYAAHDKNVSGKEIRDIVIADIEEKMKEAASSQVGDVN